MKYDSIYFLIWYREIVQQLDSPPCRWDHSHNACLGLPPLSMGSRPSDFKNANTANSPPRRWDRCSLYAQTYFYESMYDMHERMHMCGYEKKRKQASTDERRHDRAGGWSCEDLVHLGSRGQHVCYVHLHVINTQKHTHPVDCRQHACARRNNYA